MDIKQNILLTILFFCLVNINYCFSQIKAVNDKGEKIIVYPDGTWIYDKEGEKPAKVENDKPKKTPKVKTKEVEPIYTREEMIGARNEVTGRYRKARSEKEIALKEKSEISYELASYIQRKSDEHLLRPMNDIEKATYTSRVKIMKRRVKDAKKKLKIASKNEKKYQKMLTYTGGKLMLSYQKLLTKEESNNNEGLASNETKPKKSWNPIKILGKEKEPADPIEEAKKDYEKQVEEIKRKKQEELNQKIATAKLRNDKLLGYRNASNLTVSSKECELAFDEVDPFTAKRKRATKARQLFSFVGEGYEAILKGKGYLVCEGFVSEINNGKEYLLILDFIVKSTTGKEEFGGFDKGAKMMVMMIDGSMVNLKNRQGDKGTVDIGKSITTFRAYYVLPKAELKELATKEASALRVVWAGGFEDYEIFEMDFFRNQINCLKETK